ncbi:MAG: GMC family oxidoreductase [Hyphomicrobiales bacterium]|nr:GMC family oxidoreductase [Hyphomicrobiales bacterium]
MIRPWRSWDIPDSVDICIVGSGPAGLTLALELERLGRRSLVLESGDRGAGPAQSLSAAEIVDPRRHDDMSIAAARRLGGTSNLWGGRSVPLDPVDFEPRAFACGARWPFAYEELEPWYRAACAYATCGEPLFESPFDGVSVVSDEFSLSRIERSSNRPRFQNAHSERLETSDLIDIRLGATIVDLTLGENGRVSSCTIADAGGARRELEAERFVIAAGGLESARLLLLMQRRRPDLFGGAEGPLGRFYMGHVIGEIADILFADARIESAFDFLRDGAGSYVRRRFTPGRDAMIEHNLPNIAFWPVVPPVAEPRHCSGALSAVALALSTPLLGSALAPEAIRTRHLQRPIAWGPHIRNVIADAPQTIGFVGRFVRERYLSEERIPGYFLRNPARRYGLSYHAEQSPRADSRVSLSKTTDLFDTPRLAIDLRFHRDDAEAVVRAHDLFQRWFEASGFGRIEYRQPAEENAEAVDARMSHGTHQIGVARMGGARSEGVVDVDLRCFDVDNLYVVSSAVFPTSGQANPTLTIVALAARLAAHLATIGVKPILTSAPAHA